MHERSSVRVERWDFKGGLEVALFVYQNGMHEKEKNILIKKTLTQKTTVH